MSPFFDNLKDFLSIKKDPYENEPELDILVQKGDILHVLLLGLLFAYSAAYTIINYLQGSYTEMGMTIVPMFFVAIEYVLFKKGYKIISKIMNMLQVTTIVGLLSMVHSPENGVLTFYIPILVGTQLTFFGKERIYAHILTVYILSALVFFLSTDIQFEEKLTGTALKIDMFVNFLGAALATTFEIMFILSVSNKIQQTLFEKSHLLNKQNEELTKLSLIATKTKSGVIISDSWGRVEWVNEALTKITGYALEDIKNKKPKEFLQPENSNHPGFQLLHDKLKKKEYVETVVPNRKKDGTPYINQLEINPVFNDKNELINFVSLQRDITEEIRQKEETIRINERFNTISKNADIGIWVWDVTKNQTIWNDVMIEQYGAIRNEVENDLYGFWQESIFEADKEAVLQKIGNLLNGVLSVVKQDFRITRKDNRDIRYLQTVTIAERDEQGNLLQLFGTSIDVSPLVFMQLSIAQKNEELRNTNTELDRFVYSVSHDLRSPLLSIKGLLSLVFDMKELDPQVGSYLRMAEKSIVRLDDIIKEILEYSRNARMDIQYETINVRLIAEGIFEDLGFMTEDGFEFRINTNGVETMYSDRARIHTLLRNIIGNAVKYRKKRDGITSFVEFRMNKKQDEIVLEIEDNGEGIAEKNLEKVFDMFFRASNSGTGTGLGLYICKQIAEKLNGRIELTSSQQKGSTFSVIVPLVQKEA